MRPFTPGDTVVYPTVGTGIIRAIEDFSVEGISQPMYVIWFSRHQMTQRVPTTTDKLRGLSTKKETEEALRKLVGRRKKIRAHPHVVKRIHDAQLNSGALSDLTELVCNLFVTEGEVQSYTNMQVSEEATARLVDELAALGGLSDAVVYGLVEEALTTKKLPAELKRL